MNRDHVRSALAAFTASPELRVAALAGTWGVGKTYLWNEFVEKLTLPDKLNGVAYASVFGASSLDELRQRVAEALVLNRPREWLLERYKAQTGSRLVPTLLPIAQRAGKRPARWLGYARRAADDGLAGLIGSLIGDSSYWFVRDSLVALDDLERCPIEPITLMGFVDELRSRGCKVVIIANREKLDKEKHGLYWEKVVDCDIRLSPDADDNSKIVFGDSFQPADCADRARTTLRALRCDNIRIHRRAAWLIREIEPKLQGLAADVRAQAVINATVLCWVLLDPTHGISIDIVRTPDASRIWAELAEEEDDEDDAKNLQKRWRSIAQETDFSPLDFDPHLESLISTGWCDKPALEAALQKVNSEVDSQRAGKRVREEVFGTYTDAFDISRAQYVERVRTVLREELDRLYVHEFGMVLAHLRACGGDSSDLAALYIQRRGDHLNLVARAQEREPIEDPTLEAEVKQREAAYLATRFTIEEVVHGIATKDGWNHDEVQYLSERSVDEYEAWLLSGSTNLGRKVKRLLGFRKIGLGEQYPVVAAKVTEALRRLASKNDFDRERIERAYGVKLESSTQPAGNG